MRVLHVGRATWFLPVFVLATPLLLPLAGRDQSKSRKVKVDEQVESPEVASIVDRVIANENQYTLQMREYSPRVETYVQYYQPETGLGDVASNDAIFLGRLNIGTAAKEESFVADSASDRDRQHPGTLRARLHLDSAAGLVRHHPGTVRARLHIDTFAAEPLAVDQGNFDRTHYRFEPVRWEYLGDVR